MAYVKNIDIARDEEWGISNPIYNELIDLYNKYSPDLTAISEKLDEYYQQNGLYSSNISNYKYVDEHGIYRKGPIDDPQNNGPKDQRINPITGNYCITPSRGWSCTIDTWNEWIRNNLIYFPR